MFYELTAFKWMDSPSLSAEGGCAPAMVPPGDLGRRLCGLYRAKLITELVSWAEAVMFRVK